MTNPSIQRKWLDFARNLWISASYTPTWTPCMDEWVGLLICLHLPSAMYHLLWCFSWFPKSCGWFYRWCVPPDSWIQVSANGSSTPWGELYSNECLQMVKVFVRPSWYAMSLCPGILFRSVIALRRLPQTLDSRRTSKDIINSPLFFEWITVTFINRQSTSLMCTRRTHARTLV